ncbi:MAG: RNA-binding S4 domain-containing protein [Clostridia bacterium]|nr:RNA-binding S4 domain-containing protein [Clostridia bacterium]
MRLDKYLKVSRIIKRRTVANEAADGGRVMLNGKPAKPSAQVKPGDVIEIRFGEHTMKARIENCDEKAQKAEAAMMYTVLENGK